MVKVIKFIQKILDKTGFTKIIPDRYSRIEYIYGTLKYENNSYHIKNIEPERSDIYDLPKKFKGSDGDKVIVGKLYWSTDKPVLETFINTSNMGNTPIVSKNKKDHAEYYGAVDNDCQALSNKIIHLLKCQSYHLLYFMFLVVALCITSIDLSMEWFEDFITIAWIPIVVHIIYIIMTYKNSKEIYGKSALNIVVTITGLLIVFVTSAHILKPNTWLIFNVCLNIVVFLYYQFFHRKRSLSLVRKLVVCKRLFYKKLHNEAYSILGSLNSNYLNEIEIFAKTSHSILLIGETGTGKGYYANLINEKWHKQKTQEEEKEETAINLFALNCATLPKMLSGSELFGHVKGAYTGATCDRDGAIKKADGGLLFLDEIGELPLDIQSELLTFLENMTIKPVGSDKTEKVDVRIIAATDKLQNLSEPLKNRFDKIIKIPPLRMRKEQLPELASNIFKREYPRSIWANKSRAFRKADAAKLLETDYYWKGNVRQLEKAIISALMLSKKEHLSAKEIIREAKKIDQY